MPNTGLISQLEKLNRCPHDGTMLEGKNLFCKVCRSSWALHFYGPVDGTGLESREYLRRKIKEIEQHKLSATAPPPNAISKLQGGHTLFPDLIKERAVTIRNAHQAVVRARQVDRKAMQEWA